MSDHIEHSCPRCGSLLCRNLNCEMGERPMTTATKPEELPIPEWATTEAYRLLDAAAACSYPHERVPVVARALVAAEERGYERGVAAMRPKALAELPDDPNEPEPLL